MIEQVFNPFELTANGKGSNGFAILLTIAGICVLVYFLFQQNGFEKIKTFFENKK